MGCVGQFLKKNIYTAPGCVSRKYCNFKQLEQLKYNLHNKCGLCGTVFEKKLFTPRLRCNTLTAPRSVWDSF